MSNEYWQVGDVYRVNDDAVKAVVSVDSSTESIYVINQYGVIEKQKQKPKLATREKLCNITDILKILEKQCST